MWLHSGSWAASCFELFALCQKAWSCRSCVDFHFWWWWWLEGWPIVGTWTDWHSTARSEEIVDTSFVPTPCPYSCRLHPSPSSAVGCAIKPTFTLYLHLPNGTFWKSGKMPPKSPSDSVSVHPKVLCCGRFNSDDLRSFKRVSDWMR